MTATTLSGSNLPVMKSRLLNAEAGIVHFCTLRGGNATPYSEYNLCDYTGDNPAHVDESRLLFAEAIGISPERMWFPRQVHGTEVLRVDSSMPSGQEADAVITNETKLLIGVSTADCVPVLLYDPVTRAIGAVHAGWRGTVRRIAEKCVEKMGAAYGSSPSDLKAVICPSISPEAFEVGEEVANVFIEEGFADCVVQGYPKPHIDLWKANREQLLRIGLREENIDCTPICTYNNSDILFSARKLGIQSGRMVSTLMLI